MNTGLNAVVAVDATNVRAVIMAHSKQDAAGCKRDQPIWRYYHEQTRRVVVVVVAAASVDVAVAADDGDSTAAVEMLRFGTGYCAGWSVPVQLLR